MTTSNPTRGCFFTIRIVLPLVALSFFYGRAFALTTNSFVSEQSSRRSFPLFAKGTAASIFVNQNDWPGVVRVATDLQTEIKRVSGVVPALTQEAGQLGKNAIIVGTRQERAD